MVEVRLENLTKRFESNNIIAVDNINITINHGDFFTLVGPSGCGKTTTLRMIAGLETPTEGEIYFDWERVSDLTPQQRDIAMVFQDIALYPHMSCYENIGYGLKVRGETEGMEKKIEEAAEMLEISDQLEKMPSQLSGGQQQRVALGRAIVRDPNLILLDEPMSDLDAKLKADLRVAVQDLHQRIDTTIIYVTHDQEEAMTMSTRVGLMNKGRFAQVAEPDILYNEPSSVFSASFIGQPSMNILEVPITDEGELVIDNSGKVSRTLKLDRPDFDLPPEVLEYGKIKVGFRPQHVTLSDNLDDAFLPVEFLLYEQNGHEFNIYTETEDGEEVIAITHQKPEFQQNTRIALTDVSQLFLFNAQSGRKIAQLEKREYAKKIKNVSSM